MKNQEEMEQTRLVPVEVETGQIELPKIDVSKYVGKRVKIAEVGTYKGEFGLFAKISTETVDTVKGGKNPIILKGSRIFGLQQDADGNYGWGEQTKLGLFLKKMKCNKLKDLVGKEVILQTTTSKSGTDFLSF